MTLTSKERMIAALEHREADRVPIRENFWKATLNRWRAEGLPTDTNHEEFLGLDCINTVNVEWSLRLPEEVIEETEEFVVIRNADGVMQKNFRLVDTTPLRWDYPIKDRASWEELKPRLAWNESKIDLPSIKAGHEATRHLLQVYRPASVGWGRFVALMGMEAAMIAMVEDPEWAGEMFAATADHAIAGLEYMLGAGLKFDAAYITEDMGHKGKALFSPRVYREIILPCHKRFNHLCHAHGMKSILHSCGYVRELVPMFIEAGFDALNPLEVKAGMDIFEMKKTFGDVLALWGGIDARSISHPDPSVLENEIREKVTFAKQGGGYIFMSDHSIPYTVSLKQYQRMVELGLHYGSFTR